LVENGADVNKADRYGLSPTKIAKQYGCEECVSILEAAGGV